MVVLGLRYWYESVRADGTSPALLRRHRQACQGRMQAAWAQCPWDGMFLWLRPIALLAGRVCAARSLPLVS